MMKPVERLLSSEGDFVSLDESDCEAIDDIPVLNQMEDSQSDVENDNFKKMLFKVWETLSPPISEDSIIGNWYITIFQGNKIPQHFFMCHFLQDENGPIADVECMCLKEAPTMRPNIIAILDIIATCDIIAGPLVCQLKGK